jgi:hypothetical protein
LHIHAASAELAKRWAVCRKIRQSDWKIGVIADSKPGQPNPPEVTCFGNFACGYLSKDLGIEVGRGIIHHVRRQIASIGPKYCCHCLSGAKGEVANPDYLIEPAAMSEQTAVVMLTEIIVEKIDADELASIRNGRRCD